MCLGDWCGVTLTGAGQRVIIRPATSHFYAQSHAHTNTHMVTCAIQACLKMLAHAHTSYSYIRNNTITDSLAHPHTPIHTLHLCFSFLQRTCMLFHSHTLLHFLYCCAKSHSLLTRRKFVLSTGAHTCKHTPKLRNTQVQIHTYSQM